MAVSLLIIKQPNGKLAVFNKIAMTIDLWDASPQLVVDYLMERQDEHPSFSTAIEGMRHAHGWEAVGKILDTMEREHPPEA
jgi:hypothetical protein